MKSYQFYYDTIKSKLNYKLKIEEYNKFKNFEPDDYLNFGYYEYENCYMCINCKYCKNCINCINCKK